MEPRTRTATSKCAALGAGRRSSCSAWVAAAEALTAPGASGAGSAPAAAASETVQFPCAPRGTGQRPA